MCFKKWFTKKQICVFVIIYRYTVSFFFVFFISFLIKRMKCICNVFFIYGNYIRIKKREAFTFTNTNILFNMKQPNSMCYNFPSSYYKTWFAQSGCNNKGVHFVQLCVQCGVVFFFFSAKVAIYMLLAAYYLNSGGRST